MAEAHLEGERIIRNAEEKRLALLEELQELNRQKISFESGLRSLVESHLKLLEMDNLLIEETRELHTRLLGTLSDDEIDDSIKLP